MASSASEPDLVEISSEEDDGTQPETDGLDDESEIEGHLCEDLESALQEDKLELPGSYAYSSLLPFAPHACLDIEGIGSIGLPLSETDARRLIACASQAPYGQGSQTIVNKEVRDTWEIDPARVRFNNPNWLIYVQDLAVSAVCSSLGVKKYDTLPRCELYKLLIYETGSRFLPHRDTQKADGMFATMIILLPSQYTGGEIHLTHASKTQIIDLSAFSLANTAVLAWYTDVLHEVKPITYGYRLALSYNLIHTSPRMPFPIAPTDNGPWVELRRILRDWEEGRYLEPEGCQEYIAYLLKHQYSPIDFSRGVSCLKGEDSERVGLVRMAAKGLGFVVLLASLEYRVSGDSSEWGGAKRRRGSGHAVCDYNCDDGEVDISLSKIVDLDGNMVLAGGSHCSIGIDEDCFLPRDALDDETPDDTEESGYTGNEGATVDYWYHRSVFVLMLSEELPRILIEQGGIGYAVKLFKESSSENAPTQKHKDMAMHIIDKLYRAGSDRDSITKDMFDYAYKWKDVDMWRDLIKSCRGVEVQGENGLAQAWHVFHFNPTRPSIEDLLRDKRLPERLAFINAIRQAASESDEKDVIQEWCLNQATVALTSYVFADVNDVPLFVSTACTNGIQGIRQVPIEKIAPEKAFQFLSVLAKNLHFKRTVVLEQTEAYCTGSDNPQSEAARMLDEFIRTCLDCAGKQWNLTPSYYSTSSMTSNQQRLVRVLDIVELCLLTRQIDTCRVFLDRVWNVSGELVDKFNTIYIPLVPELCELLQRTNTDIYAPPFAGFFHLLISYYLCYVLGARGQRIQMTRKIGCGCADCQELDRFIAGKETQYTFRIIQMRRTHLERQMNEARDVVIHETRRLGSPHSLVVTKTRATVTAGTWEYRLQIASSMFSAIGERNVEKIMGSQYVDVCKALKGQATFHLDNTVVQRQNVPGPISTSTTNTTTSAIGGKRKLESLEVIELSD